MIRRRGLLVGLLCAPAIVRPGMLMPVKRIVTPRSFFIFTGFDEYGRPKSEIIRVPDMLLPGIRQIGASYAAIPGHWSSLISMSHP